MENGLLEDHGILYKPGCFPRNHVSFRECTISRVLLGHLCTEVDLDVQEFACTACGCLALRGATGVKTGGRGRLWRWQRRVAGRMKQLGEACKTETWAHPNRSLGMGLGIWDLCSIHSKLYHLGIEVFSLGTHIDLL